MAKTCDLIIIGLGIGPIEVANQAAAGGLAVTAVEQNLVSGGCPHWGCIPSKFMVRAAGSLAEATHVDELAGRPRVAPDSVPVSRRVRETTEGWSDASAAKRLRERGVNLIRGRATILGPAEVGVNGQHLGCRRITGHVACGLAIRARIPLTTLEEFLYPLAAFLRRGSKKRSVVWSQPDAGSMPTRTCNSYSRRI